MQMVEFLYTVTVIKSNTLGNCPSCEIQFCERNGRVNSSTTVLCYVEIAFFFMEYVEIRSWQVSV